MLGGHQRNDHETQGTNRIERRKKHTDTQTHYEMIPQHTEERGGVRVRGCLDWIGMKRERVKEREREKESEGLVGSIPLLLLLLLQLAHRAREKRLNYLRRRT